MIFMPVIANCKCTPIGGYIQYNLQLETWHNPLRQDSYHWRLAKVNQQASEASAVCLCQSNLEPL